MRPNIAYSFLDGDKGEGVPVGMLKAKIAVVFNTSNTLKKGNRKYSVVHLKLCGRNAFLNSSELKISIEERSE